MKYLALILPFLMGCACQGVIGVIYNQDGKVYRVFDHSPAKSIGIHINDIILDHYSTKGRPGTKVIVKWFHKGKLYEKETVRVCAKTLNPEGW